MKQRSDYTFKYNSNIGRHGWLRLTPAYSIKLVQEILNNYITTNNCRTCNILDPFCGTATTGIVAAELGFNSTLYDINPFLVWFGTIKARNYNIIDLDNIYQRVLTDIWSVSTEGWQSWVPPMKNIDRWWNDRTLSVLATIRKYITTIWGTPSYSDGYNLLWIAFARLVIETSAADFNHISTSFKEHTIIYETQEVVNIYLTILRKVVDSAKVELKGKTSILHGDSRLLQKENDTYDLVITSPPYPNRISYIRELRPYMYWLHFLESGKQAGELDWQAIGGTWGTATSKLCTWENVNKDLPQCLYDICAKIELSNKKNGRTMSHYVLKFFDDMYIHFSSLRHKLNAGAEINYILGNSSFYNNYVDTENIIKEILHTLGYTNIDSIIIRKRNCSKGLYEYRISANG